MGINLVVTKSPIRILDSHPGLNGNHILRHLTERSGLGLPVHHIGNHVVVTLEISAPGRVTRRGKFPVHEVYETEKVHQYRVYLSCVSIFCVSVNGGRVNTVKTMLTQKVLLRNCDPHQVQTIDGGSWMCITIFRSVNWGSCLVYMWAVHIGLRGAARIDRPAGWLINCWAAAWCNVPLLGIILYLLNALYLKMYHDVLVLQRILKPKRQNYL